MSARYRVEKTTRTRERRSSPTHVARMGETVTETRWAVICESDGRDVTTKATRREANRYADRLNKREER